MQWFSGAVTILKETHTYDGSYPKIMPTYVYVVSGPLSS